MHGLEVESAFEMLCMRRRLETVVPAFINGDVAGCLDALREIIKTMRFLHGAFESKKNAGTGMRIDFRVSLLGRKSAEATAKDLEEREVHTAASAHGNGRSWTIATNHAISNQDKMHEGVWPTVSRQIGGKEHRAGAVGDGAMRPFDLPNFA